MVESFAFHRGHCALKMEDAVTRGQYALYMSESTFLKILQVVENKDTSRQGSVQTDGLSTKQSLCAYCCT